MLVPELRFRRDDGSEYPEWDEKRLGDNFTFKNGVNASREAFYSGGVPCIGVSDVYKCRPIKTQDIIGRVNLPQKDFSNNAVNYGDVLFQRSSETKEDIGHASVYIGDGVAVYNGFVICGKPRKLFYNALFLHHELQSNRVRKQTISLGAGAQHYNIGQENLAKITVRLPCSEEQEKIAAFMSDLDEAISASEAEVATLELQKKGFMQKIFSQEVRFCREDGTEYPEWEERTLDDVFEISHEKNGVRYGIDDILSVSDEFGVVNQIEFHGRSFAGESIENYKVVKPGQIVYTRSPLAAKPYGIIKIVGNVRGIVSPLYVVNNVRSGNSSDFWYYNFDSPDRTNRYLKPIVRAGAKHTMNVSHEEWLSGTVFVPCFEEQQKIAAFLSDIDETIDLAKQELEQWKLLKKGLMQKMFV